MSPMIVTSSGECDSVGDSTLIGSLSAAVSSEWGSSLVGSLLVLFSVRLVLSSVSLSFLVLLFTCERLSSYQ